MTPQRLKRIKEVVSTRQLDLTVILENVHDPHNIAAVLRTCDSVGIREIFGLYTDPSIDLDHFKIGKKTSSGARKWVDVYLFEEIEQCFATVRKSYQRILATHLGKETTTGLFEMDLNGSLALMFGNEHDGLSKAALQHADDNFVIPQMGMVRSLNISVACAITLYETMRQRMGSGKYSRDTNNLDPERQRLLEEYCERHETKYKGRAFRDGSNQRGAEV